VDGQLYAELEAAARAQHSGDISQAVAGNGQLAGDIGQVAAGLLRQGLRQQALQVQAEAALASLTPRQREVARLAGRGCTNLQIAQTLVVSPETVKTHMRHVLERLGLRGKPELQLLLLASRQTPLASRRVPGELEEDEAPASAYPSPPSEQSLRLRGR
jgi:DNA-binding NarL/FixJ family response regulator